MRVFVGNGTRPAGSAAVSAVSALIVELTREGVVVRTFAVGTATAVQGLALGEGATRLFALVQGSSDIAAVAIADHAGGSLKAGQQLGSPIERSAQVGPSGILIVGNRILIAQMSAARITIAPLTAPFV